MAFQMFPKFVRMSKRGLLININNNNIRHGSKLQRSLTNFNTFSMARRNFGHFHNEYHRNYHKWYRINFLKNYMRRFGDTPKGAQTQNVNNMNNGGRRFGGRFGNFHEQRMNLKRHFSQFHDRFNKDYHNYYQHFGKRHGHWHAHRGRIYFHGLSFGTCLAVVISYNNYNSIVWAIIHGFLSWIYVIYYALNEYNKQEKNANELINIQIGQISEEIEKLNKMYLQFRNKVDNDELSEDIVNLANKNNNKSTLIDSSSIESLYKNDYNGKSDKEMVESLKEKIDKLNKDLVKLKIKNDK